MSDADRPTVVYLPMCEFKRRWKAEEDRHAARTWLAGLLARLPWRAGVRSRRGCGVNGPFLICGAVEYRPKCRPEDSR